MASDSLATEYTDTASLLDYGFDNFSIYNISSREKEFLNEDNSFFTKYSSIFNAKNSFWTTGEDGYVVLPNNVDLSDATKEIKYIDLEELKEGDNVIGNVTYTYQDRIVGQTDIIYRNVSTDTLPTKINTIIESSRPNSWSSETANNRNLKPTIVVVILALLVLMGVGYFVLIARPRARRRKAYLKRRKAYKRQYNDFE